MAFPKEPLGTDLLTFDIFRGHYLDKEAVWVQAVEGLGKARERMRKIAADNPGPYFVFSWPDQLVLDIVNTASNLERRLAKHKVAGAA